jgi:hypothetical protein
MKIRDWSDLAPGNSGRSLYFQRTYDITMTVDADGKATTERKPITGKK